MWSAIDRESCMADLLDCLIRFAERSSNPVLDLLDDESLQETHRYPPSGLEFGDSRWRAFYHCHGSPRRRAGEHGHFHIFARPDAARDDWTHVAGLAMDCLGQPVEWFAVNQWVTGGSWLPADDLIRRLPVPVPAPHDGLTERWLAGMVCAYKDDIQQLLRQRDRALAAHVSGNDGAAAMKNRAIYDLAASGIDLRATLEGGLGDLLAAGADDAGCKAARAPS